ncbi:RNA polymerase II transcription factor subunit [Parasponia andersonii]|uniref:RNA polymerase II transcription factor subunit n=1 Tax=Parasponia andersonii TaxID=3476 RepID=A0A2P5D7Z9_PARAD|nr:RNA polymerase II transcription factor subunit [Parasponia andersonii]
MVKNRAPSLVDLCVYTAIDNVRYLGDVGETDSHLLDRILPHCTVDQLEHIEKSTEGRDLSPITDKLWRKFYEIKFGVENTKTVVERMREKKVTFKWMKLYEAKMKDAAEKQNIACDRIAQLYKKENDRKQSRQVRLCTKVPPSSSKRSFFGGSGPGYNVSNVKSNLMKKAKIEFLKSNEVRNLLAMKKTAVKTNYRTSPIMKPGVLSGKDLASTSKQMKPVSRRF